MSGAPSRDSLLRAIDRMAGVPVLVVAGSRDGFTPPDLSAAMAAAVPDAELLVVDGGSHTAPLERPEFVNDAVVAFLERALAASADPVSRKASGQTPLARDADLTVADKSRP